MACDGLAPQAVGVVVQEAEWRLEDEERPLQETERKERLEVEWTCQGLGGRLWGLLEEEYPKAEGPGVVCERRAASREAAL